MACSHAILNSGCAAWAFAEHADRLSEALWVEVTSSPARFNYLLGWDAELPPEGELLIPWNAIKVASDKRLQASLFSQHDVSAPRTVLVETASDLRRFLQRETNTRWVLKYPTACGASGHRFLGDLDVPTDWPLPYVVQEFINLERPEVYRLYCVAGEIFGWNARRFPEGVRPSPWVAHARGARYVHLGEAPNAAMETARAALHATNLLSSFGVVDLLKKDDRWLALEVGTDGLFSHVDRDFDNPELDRLLNQKLAEAFWSRSVTKPWGNAVWRPRQTPVNQ